MSRVPALVAPDYKLITRDRDWIAHVLPKEDFEIPREHVPDPDSENLPSSLNRQESTVELEKRWTDVGIDRISLNCSFRRY